MMFSLGGELKGRECIYNFYRLNVDTLSFGSLKLDISDISGASLTNVGSVMHFGRWRRI